MSETTDTPRPTRLLITFDGAGGCEVAQEGVVSPVQLLGAAALLDEYGRTAIRARAARMQAPRVLRPPLLVPS